MKACTRCHKVKPPDYFQRNASTPSGRRSICKQCEKGRRGTIQKVEGSSPPVVEPGLDESRLDDLELGPAGVAPIAPVTPEEAHEAAPPGYAVKGVSTLYGASGEVVQQWVKTRQEEIDRMAALEKAVLRICEPFKDYADPVAAPDYSNDDLMCCLVMGDAHFGQHSWRPECGDHFDLEIAERLTFSAVDRLVGLSPAGSEAVIVNVGDYFHTDNSSNQTTRSGHQLDVDTRWPNVLSVGIRAMRRCIDRALEKHSRVRVISALGNHDDHSAVMLSLCLANFYAREPRVTVDPSVGEFNWIRFGSNLIGVTHGHTMKPQRMREVMTVDRARDWGETRHRHIYSGHVHHDSSSDSGGCTVETLATLAAKDKHAARSGYRADRNMKCDVWHREHGRIRRDIVGVEQLEAEAA
jgi:hypothetical protein